MTAPASTSLRGKRSASVRVSAEELERLRALERDIDDIKSEEWHHGYDAGYSDGSGYGERYP